MKHTNHNDPFDYDQYKDESFWDFSWENDKWMIVGLVAMIGFCLVILFTVSSLEVSLVDSNRGCVTSAYQASTNGFDLEDNLEVCNNL